MEISSFPEDYPSFFSFVQDPEPSSTISFSSSSKRPKRGDFDQEILNKFLAFDYPMEDDETKQLHSPILFNPNNDQQINETDAYYSNDHLPNLIHSGISSNTKRARSDFDNAVTISDESTSVANEEGIQRRMWVKDRSKAWWEQVNSPDFPEEEFKKVFRMGRATFDMICDELESVVTKKDTMLRSAIPVRQRVAVCIWRLAAGEALREVSERFGLGISTCHKLVLEVCTAIRTVLMPKFLQWPDNNKIRDIKREFELFSGIPNVAGSIYTTHIPIIAPKVSTGSYFNKRQSERNQKTSYSVTVQGVVDCNGAFTNICIGWPGSMTDGQVLEKSALFQRVNKGLLKDICVVGHSGYPLTDWVLVPYTHQNLTWAQQAYNEKVEGVQKVVKESFMRMKGRWKCLQKRIEMKIQDLPVVLGACCVLHNICEVRNEGFSDELRFELFDDEMIPENNVRSVNAISARDLIAQKILHQCP